MLILLNHWFRHGHIKCTFFVLFEALNKAVGISLYYYTSILKNAREPSWPWESQPGPGNVLKWHFGGIQTAVEGESL